MALPYRIQKLDDVAEQYRGEYVKTQDGTYVLEVDGAVDKTKLDEFRNNNIDLKKQLDQINNQFKDLTPERVAELQKLQKQREERELLDKGEIDTVLANRTAEMKTTYETTIDSLKKQNDLSTRQLEVLMIDNSVRDMAIKSGVRDTAIDDVLLRAKNTFSIRDGKVVAVQVKDGKEEIVYGPDGQKPLSIQDWGKSLKTAAPHLFMESQGGGSNNTRQNGATKPTTALGKISQGLSEGI